MAAAQIEPKEPLKELFKAQDALISLTAKVSSDLIKLFLDIEFIPGSNHRQITVYNILDLLKERLNTEAINRGVLDDIVNSLKSGVAVTERRILKGKAPEPGIDGKLLLLVKKFSGVPDIVKDEKAKSSFHELHLFDNIEKGKIVARLYPPKAGADGIDVFGKSIPSKPGLTVKLTLDKSLQLRKDPADSYEIVEALSDGYLIESSGRMSIHPELEVKGDLDFRYGNIEFVGSVKIAGDVLPGFQIKARNGILVKGSVRGGSLISSHGAISVGGFVFGGGGSKIISGQSFKANIVQEVNADIRGDIEITKEAQNSILRSQACLRMPTGQMFGGEAHVVKGAEFKILGNKAEGATTVFLCGTIEATREYGELMVNIANHQKAAELLKLHLGPYAENQARVQLLKSPLRERMRSLYDKLSNVLKSHAKLIADRQEMLAQSKRDEQIYVNIKSLLYPGVVVKADDQIFKSEIEIKGPKTVQFDFSSKKFETLTYKELAASVTDGEGKLAKDSSSKSS